jgi:exodeoxyribonuclease 10
MPILFDTETTSADPSKARVVEIATYDTLTKNMYGMRCFPAASIEIGAMATHHITIDSVRGLPQFSQTAIFKYIKERVATEIFVAHNAPYDTEVLHNEDITLTRVIDTLRVAKHLCSDDEPESYSLQYLRYFYKLDELAYDDEALVTQEGSPHSALYDTVVLRWLYTFLYRKVQKLYPGKNPDEVMMELSGKIPLMHRFRFGKYRGEKFADVAEKDPQYIEWLLAKHDDPEVVMTCRHYLNK